MDIKYLAQGPTHLRCSINDGPTPTPLTSSEKPSLIVTPLHPQAGQDPSVVSLA